MFVAYTKFRFSYAMSIFLRVFLLAMRELIIILDNHGPIAKHPRQMSVRLYHYDPDLVTMKVRVT